MKRSLIFLLVIFFIIGCAGRRQVTAPEAKAPAEIQKEEVREVIPPAGEEEISPEKAAREGAFPAVEELPFEFNDALFDFDKYNIRPDARVVLDSTAEWLNNHKDLNILIEGHCDERGTNEYNLALGEKRAKAAKGYLISKGIAPDRMSTISYGEEKPLCTAHNENCWQRNRRAHFVITK